MAIKNNKVVDQFYNLEKKETSIAAEMLKERHPGAKISIENSSGKVVRVEACDASERAKRDAKAAAAIKEQLSNRKKKFSL